MVSSSRPRSSVTRTAHASCSGVVGLASRTARIAGSFSAGPASLAFAADLPPAGAAGGPSPKASSWAHADRAGVREVAIASNAKAATAVCAQGAPHRPVTMVGIDVIVMVQVAFWRSADFTSSPSYRESAESVARNSGASRREGKAVMTGPPRFAASTVPLDGRLPAVPSNHSSQKT